MAGDPTTDAYDDGGSLLWQFDALDLRPVERWLVSLPLRDRRDGLPTVTAVARPPMRLHDRYLDTEDRRIGQAGLVLRTRQRGRQDEASLRPLAHPGIHRDGHQPAVLRGEVAQSISTGGTEGIVRFGPVGSRVDAVIGRRPLTQVLEVRTRRRPFALRAGGEDGAELTLDDTIIAIGGGGRPVQLRRVRVRIPHGQPAAYREAVDELRTSCGLRPALLTKFDAGMLALGVAPPGPPDLGPLDVTPASTLGDLAFAVIRRQLVAIAAREPGTRLGEDPEELHDMRVATRRLRAALELFADALPARAQALRAELGWLAGVLGTVRDLDVQLERMDEMEAWVSRWATVAPGGPHPLHSLSGLLQRDRAARRRELLNALDSVRWTRMWSGLAAMARQGPARRSPGARAPAVLAIPDLVVASHRSVMKAARRAGRSREVADFHRLRIRCKRLRYTLEFTAELYGRRSVLFARRLAVLQDKLGLMQDAEVATANLLAAATSGTEQLPPAAVFAMGSVAERYRLEAAELLAGMPDRLRILQRREWSELADLMDRRRTRALAALAVARTTLRATPAPDAATDGTPPAPALSVPGAGGAAVADTTHRDVAAGSGTAGMAGAQTDPDPVEGVVAHPEPASDGYAGVEPAGVEPAGDQYPVAEYPVAEYPVAEYPVAEPADAEPADAEPADAEPADEDRVELASPKAEQANDTGEGGPVIVHAPPSWPRGIPAVDGPIRLDLAEIARRGGPPN
jgi:CHAD domain-containing protein